MFILCLLKKKCVNKVELQTFCSQTQFVFVVYMVMTMVSFKKNRAL